MEVENPVSSFNHAAQHDSLNHHDEFRAFDEGSVQCGVPYTCIVIIIIDICIFYVVSLTFSISKCSSTKVIGPP